MPAVSVIIPVYDVEAYVGRCARSLFSQTLSDIEYIFVDDCTPDRSMQVVEDVLADFPARRPQVKTFRMNRNSGQAAVRMQALSLATGDYVIHCDSDDTVEPDAYRLLWEKAVSEDLDIVTCDFLKEGKNGWKHVDGNCPSVDALLRDRAPWNLVCRLVRRSLLDGIVPPAGNMGEDMVITLQATLRASRTGHVGTALYRYWYRPSSISKTSGKDAALGRWKSLTANVSLAVDLLCREYGYRGDEPALTALKYYSRHHLEPFLGDPSVRRLWRDTFPEVDRKLLFTPGIPLETRFWFALIHLHLYGPVKRVTALFRQNHASSALH